MTKTRQQQQIEKILGEEEQEDKDHSLRAQALERAKGEQLPKTMTPWEWQQWYDAHGVPPEHSQEDSGPGLCKRLFSWLGRKKPD